MTPSLYVKYGSRLTTGLSELIYDRLLADAELAPFFEHIDIDLLREHMADFLTVVTGGPDIYRGRNIREAHRNFTITNAHFDRLMQHIEAALQELALDPADISTVLETISGTRSDIVTS